MSGWRGANVVAAEEAAAHAASERQRKKNAHASNSRKGSSDDDGEDDSDDKRQSHHERHPQRPSETVEASLHRLSTAYRVATDCIAAWHRAGTTASTTQASPLPPPTDAAAAAPPPPLIEQLSRIGRTARRTLEEAVLQDPLVLPLLHASWKLDGTMDHASFHQSTTTTPALTSASHQALVKQLAYLSLVNYSDLLLAGLPTVTVIGSTPEASSTSSLPTSKSHSSLLDRGVIQSLPVFQQTSCWGNDDNDNEPSISVAHRALVALVDATSLDGSDPVVWLKLACVARKVGRLAADADNDNYDKTAPNVPVECFLKHRALERYALEQGMVCLPDTMPPNRLIVQALTEWKAENDQLSHPDVQYPPRLLSSMKENETDNDPLCVTLSRYSWSALARILLRLCRDGTLAEPTHPRHHPHLSPPGTAKCTRTPASGPVRFALSPMLALPSTALARICQFLPDSNIWRFEATCRALSSSILSARTTAILDAARSPIDRFPATAVAGALDKPEGTVAAAADTAAAASGVNAATPIAAPPPPPPQASRASKRLQTQIITSGRRSDRQHRRNSVEYCLVAATCGCTPESPDYQTAKTSNPWQFRCNTGATSRDTNLDASQRSSDRSRPRNSVYEKLQRQREEARERIGDSSLLHFVQRYNGGGVANHPTAAAAAATHTSMEVLFGFVAHASVHIGHVFMTDPGGTMVLMSSLLECIEVLLSYCHAKDASSPSWSSGDLPNLCGNFLGRGERFAIDLLQAELRLRRCDRDDTFEIRCGSDALVVTDLVTTLPEVLEELESNPESIGLGVGEWTRLKTRCTWFQSNYYLWRSRISRCLVESRDAERIGLDLIDQTISVLGGPEGQSPIEVPVPHLTSSTRSGACWKVLSIPSLVSFRNDIQAASVVLQSREQFVKIVSQFDRQNPAEDVDGKQEEALIAIGESLLQRYGTPVDCLDAKLVELIDDFLSIHGEYLRTVDWSSNGREPFVGAKSWFNELLPFGKQATPSMILSLPPNSSILSILFVCLQTLESGPLETALLLARLVITIGRTSQRILQRMSLTSGETLKIQSESDDDSSVSSEDDLLRDRDKADQRVELKKLHELSNLLALSIYRLRDVLRNYLNDDTLSLFSTLPEAPELIQLPLSYCCDLAAHSTKLSVNLMDDKGDAMILKALLSLFRTLDVRGESVMRRDKWDSINRCFLEGLVVSMVKQKEALNAVLHSPVGRQERAARLQRMRNRADFLADVCCRLGLTFSLQASAVQDGMLLLQSNILSDKDHCIRESGGAVICESLIWLWNSALSDDTGTLKDRLIVPVATAITGYCGFAANSSRRSGLSQSMAEFFDSDDSAMDLVSESESEGTDDKRLHRAHVLRVISQAVHCIDNTFGTVDDNEAVSFSRCDCYMTRFGPTLPLVASRVLNNFAEILLRVFYEDDSTTNVAQDPVWLDYPDGVRTTGLLTDALLYKSFRCLHAFALVHANDTRDVSSTSSRPLGKRFQPESVNAAVKLYRCIMRAYSNGRRSPPKAALDMVVDSLPPLQESKKRQGIYSFLFSNGRDCFSREDLMKVVLERPDWNDLLCERSGISWAVLEASESSGSSSDDCTIVRRGISRLLAQAPLSSNQESGSDRDERATAALAEEEFSRKFSAIIDDLSLGETNDFEGWFKAAQCLIGKADLIADRIGLTNGFSRSRDFVVRERLGKLERKITLAQLLQEQETSAIMDSNGWVSCLGPDLSAYSRFCWSSFSSLQSAMVEIASLPAPSYCHTDPNPGSFTADAQCRRVQEVLGNLWTEKELALWQQAWGSLFVSSLRQIAYRCMFLALSFAYKGEHTSDERSQGLLTQIFEVLGSLFYSELSGSQIYGYPMRTMPPFIKREAALASLCCFDKAVEIAAKSGSRVTWDLLFMIGKCNEKVAHTYSSESFLGCREDSTTTQRQFEIYMARAFQAYSDSLAAGRLNEKEGLISEQNGGSCHGSAEVLYRLHASRLKCLIGAVNRREEETDLAEAEALRLTESFWFVTPEAAPRETRDRVWSVLSDAVGALVQCRNDFSFFHRSVYRHAQALMWAPVLCDPRTERRHGNLGTIPASRACSLRGMDSSNAANSALTIMSSLFEKKRQQLVAVWVTASGDDSPFQSVNSTIRKYDSLRGKYISAYLDCLRLCTKKAELETFLRWSISCARDQPSLFSASAEALGGAPLRGHMEDSLLTTDHSLLAPFGFLASTKRQVNGALATVIASDLENSSDVKKAEDSFKEAYTCFLRLKCTPDGLVKSRSWTFLHTGNVAVDLANRCIREVVDAITYAFTRSSSAPLTATVQSDWSNESQLAALLRLALQKGKDLYPTLSSSHFLKKATTPKRKKAASAAPSSACSTELRKSYQVTVPPGLEAGHTFVVSVNEGNGSRKVRLTVPDQPVQMMRFTLPAAPPTVVTKRSGS